MEKSLLKLLCICLISFVAITSKAQTVLFNFNFQSTTLPTGVTSDGAISPTKTADGVCSQGAIQVNQAGYFQVIASSCNVVSLNMKSTGASARTVAVKYKKDGDAAFTTLSPSLTVQAAATFNLTTLYPVLVTSAGITVRLEPTNGNIQIHDLYVTGNSVASNAAEITAFTLPGQSGSSVINSAAGTIAINVPMGTDVSNVVPQTVTLSPGATINPLASIARNFTSPVNYTVTAQDGTTTKTWTVTVTQVASSAKEITAFKLSNQQIGDAVINSAAGTIAVTMPNTVSLTNLTPVIFTTSANAVSNPLGTSAQNFSSPVVYTITAQDNSTKTWTVTVTQVDPNATFTTYEAEEASYTGAVESAHTGFTGTGYINFLAGGDNQIIFSVCQQAAGNRTAKFVYALANDEIRTGSLFVNDVFVDTLFFTRGATFTEYKEKLINLDLLQGLNNIKITWDTTDGPNLDKLMLAGAPCNSYTLSTNATNGGTVSVTPARTNNKYFDGEQVTLSAISSPSLQFGNWSGDLTGNTTPATITMNANKAITGNFTAVPTYTLNVTTEGLGTVTLSPLGGQYAQGTVVTLTAQTVLGSTFTGWQQDASGTTATTTVTMNSNKNVKAVFSSSYTFNFENVVGFAAASGDGFTGPTTGGQNATDTLVINGPSEFNKLCEGLYNRQQAYKNNTIVGGMKKAKLVILLKAGIYDGTQSLSTNGAKVFGNYMLDIPEQGDLTFIGQSGVVFKIGINVKRAYNLIIRNISFQDYYDDGINVGYPQTHHIWIDHCTLGSPVGLPADSEHPDGGVDIKDGASYVTVSWCLVRNSWKTSLVGHSDGNGSTDIGRLKVTYYNNYFVGTNSRNPRVRFGEVHVLNNLLERVQLYGTVAANTAQVYVENNFYLNTDWPMYADRAVADFKAVYGNNTDNTYTSKTGNYPAVGLKQTGNEYDDSGLPVITAQINPAMLNPGGRSIKFDELNPGGVFNPSSYYSYTPLPASVVRVVVPIYAGADKVSFPINNSTLPVRFLSFNVSLSTDKKAKATWTTAEEKNTQSFDVQRSNSGYDFITIGNVLATNASGINNYSFTDAQSLKGVSYYRLKEIDKDGKLTYSSIFRISNNEGYGLSVYPNPVKHTLTVTHPRADEETIVKIVTIDGRMVKAVKAKAGFTNIAVNDISAGTYFVQFVNKTETVSQKFIKE
jgi:pectate lyase